MVAIKTGKDFTTIPGDTPTDLGYNGTNATGYKLYHEPYHQLVIPGSDESKRQLNPEGLPSDIIEGSVFISEQVDHHISVFSISPYGVLAPCGATAVLAKEDIIGTQSLANAIDIYGLTTSNIPSGTGGTPGEKPTSVNSIPIPGNTPNFTWQAGINIQFDEPGIYITNEEVDYRITIREPADPSSINTPSTNIYFEFTGYNSTVMSAPSFTFGTDYNNPDIYDAYNHSNSLAGGGAADGKNYFKNDASGYLVQSGLSLPIRKFDIVVEAHDAEGRTSVGTSTIVDTKNSNKVYDNTINTNDDSSETWNYRNPTNSAGSLGGYDILGCYIEPISGIVFPSEGNLLDSQFVSPEIAFNRDYPYLASMKTFPDGHSQLAIDESESSQEGNFVLTQTQIDDVFAEAAGIVFYYTTGNEDLQEVYKTPGDPLTPVVNRIAQWRAPQFTIDQNAIASSISGRKFGNVATDVAGQAQKDASVLIKPTEYNETNTENSTVFRDYRLLEPGQKVSDFLFQFAKSKVVSVDNAQFCIGAFDQLSYLAHFNDDGSPKTKTVTYTKTPPEDSGEDPAPATEEIATILTDPNIKFSKLASTAYIEAENTNVAFGGNSGGRFKTTQSPTSFLVVEESMITTKDKDLSYKAWCDFSFEPLKVIDPAEKRSYWHVKEPDFFIKRAGSSTRSWQLTYDGNLSNGVNGVARVNSMPVGDGLTSDIRQIDKGQLIGRNITNVKIIENSFNGTVARPVAPSKETLSTSIYPKLATTIEIEFYEPLNSIAMPTPILQVYSDFRELDEQGNIIGIDKDYTQPTPTPQQVRDTVNLKDEVGLGNYNSWAASAVSYPPPTVSLLETNATQSSVRLLVEYGNESTFNFDSAVARPVIPARIKIVVGFLENSYNRHV